MRYTNFHTAPNLLQGYFSGLSFLLLRVWGLFWPKQLTEATQDCQKSFEIDAQDLKREARDVVHVDAWLTVTSFQLTDSYR